MNNLILNSQKKQILDSIVSNGLEPASFIWFEEDTQYSPYDKVSCLRYKGTNFFFKFDFFDEKHYCVYSPGEHKFIEENFSSDWSSELRHVAYWLLYLKREIDTPDPWEEIEKYIPGGKIDLEDERANNPFNFSQVEHITRSLNKLKEEIIGKYELEEKQKEVIQNKLDYLIDRAKKVGRIDWKNIFISTIITLSFDLAMNPEQVNLLWSLVKSCFGGFILLGNK